MQTAQRHRAEAQKPTPSDPLLSPLCLWFSAHHHHEILNHSSLNFWVLADLSLPISALAWALRADAGCNRCGAQPLPLPAPRWVGGQAAAACEGLPLTKKNRYTQGRATLNSKLENTMTCRERETTEERKKIFALGPTSCAAGLDWQPWVTACAPPPSNPSPASSSYPDFWYSLPAFSL